MHRLGWLAVVHGLRRHLVDEVVMFGIEPMLLTLHVERDLLPIELAVGVTERAGTVLLAFRRRDALGVADGTGILDLAADFLLVVLAQARSGTRRLSG